MTAHRRFEETQRKPGGVRIDRHDAVRRTMLAPIRGLYVDRNLAFEHLDAFPGESLDLFRRLQRFQTHGNGRTIDALAMEIEIRSYAVKPAGSVECGGAEPHGVRGRPDKRWIA